MKYAKLGKTDITVSRFCLGCMGFGEVREGALHKWMLGPDDTRTIVEQALNAGITFFDTAMAYSFGTSEEYVGAALRSLAPRDQWVIATKVTSPIVGATKPHHIEGPAAAADLVLTPEEIAYLEEPYVPHALVGVMAQNRA